MDDILVVCKDDLTYNIIRDATKDLGPVKMFLNIMNTRDYRNGAITLTQGRHIQSISKRFWDHKANPKLRSLMPRAKILLKDPDQEIPYAEIEQQDSKLLSRLEPYYIHETGYCLCSTSFVAILLEPPTASS